MAMRFGLYDGNPHTLDEIGRALGLTRERNPAAWRSSRCPSCATRAGPSRCSTTPADLGWPWRPGPAGPGRRAIPRPLCHVRQHRGRLRITGPCRRRPPPRNPAGCGRTRPPPPRPVPAHDDRLAAAAQFRHLIGNAGHRPRPRAVIGASTTTRSKPAARSTFAGERIPPSIQRRPLIDDRGPDSRHRAARPRPRGPDPRHCRRRRVANSPVSASTTVMSSRARRAVMRAQPGLDDSAPRRRQPPVRARSAVRPSRTRARTGLHPGSPTAHTNLAMVRVPILATTSPSAGASSLLV